MISRVGRIALSRCPTTSIAIIIRSRSITGGAGAAFGAQEARWSAHIFVVTRKGKSTLGTAGGSLIMP